MEKVHHYQLEVTWTGNTGDGTSSYRGYSRDHEIRAKGKPSIAASSDPSFRGDPARWNPEDLLVASLSACHKLWYLGLCAQESVVVTAYEEKPVGVMIEEKTGAGQFTSVILRPYVVITQESNKNLAYSLHYRAQEMCFIARSVNFTVSHEPIIATVKTR